MAILLYFYILEHQKNNVLFIRGYLHLFLGLQVHKNLTALRVQRTLTFSEKSYFSEIINYINQICLWKI